MDISHLPIFLLTLSVLPAQRVPFVRYRNPRTVTEKTGGGLAEARAVSDNHYLNLFGVGALVMRGAGCNLDIPRAGFPSTPAAAQASTGGCAHRIYIPHV